jgi:hypothetical protein
MTDITDLILYSENSAFHNNNIYEGTVTISGNHSSGANVKTFTVELDVIPDLTDITFNGLGDPNSNDPRPDDGWFKTGAIYEQSADGGGGFPVWIINSSINGDTVTITATYTQQYTGTYSTSGLDLSYRIIDYSVFP